MILMTANISVINDVQITKDPETGKTHFEPIKFNQKDLSSCIDDRSAWQKFLDWWNDTPVKPYIKKRNLENPFGGYDSSSRTATEIGIKISF